MALELKALLDSTGVTGGIEAMRSKVNEFGREVNSELGGVTKMFNPMTVAAVGVGVALAFIKEGISQAFDKAENVTKMSQQFGIGTTRLQELGNAAQHNGSSMEDLSGAMNKLQKNVQDAVNGDEKQIEAFKRMGVSADDLKTKNLDDIFLQISDSTKTSTNSAQTYSDVLQTMGRSAGSLIPTLKQGSAAIIEQGDAGGVMSEDTIATLDQMSKKWKETTDYIISVIGNLTASFFKGIEIMQAYWNNFGEYIGTRIYQLGQAFDDVIHGKFKAAWNDMVTDGVKAFDDLVQKNKDSVAQIAADHQKAMQDARDKISDGKRTANTDAADEKATKQAEKEADEIARLDKDTADRQEKDAYDKLSLMEKISKEKQDIETNTNKLNDPKSSPLQKAQAKNDIAKGQETLDALQKEQKKADDEAAQKKKDKADKLAAEKKKQVFEHEKSELESVDKVLKKKLEAAKAGEEHVAIDSARASGGNLSKGAALALQSKDNFAKQQVDLTKQMNDNLAQIAKLMSDNEKANNVNGFNMSDGSFN